MGKLAEYLKAEADSIRRERERRRAAIAEWVAALDDLFARVDQWLDASDPDGLLERSAPPVQLWDPALGHYTAPSRRISVGDKVAEIVPKARSIAWPLLVPGTDRVVRAHGLVELRDPVGRTVYLFQLPGGQWAIKTDADNINVSANRVEPLDAERFETALTTLL